MMLPRWEHMLLNPVANYLRRKGYRHQRPEVGFFEHRMDLYAYSDRGQVSLAVELKLRRWRCALRQALLYQLCSDRVLIAMPEAVIGCIDKDLLRSHGVGLLAVGARGCKQILVAAPSPVVRERYRSEYIKMVKGVA